MKSFTDNKKLLKNTVALYLRMAFAMCVGLYTSRIVLEALGVSSFGLYNAVGGIVVILSFLNGSFATATQRFLNFEQGGESVERQKKVFKTACQLHGIISLIIVFFAETVGLWFVNNELNIPAGMGTAANWVYQFSIMTIVLSIMYSPCTAAIVSHEDMTIFAYISIFEVLGKLACGFAILYSSSERLILYAGLMCLVKLISFLLYWGVCHRKYLECRGLSLKISRDIFKQMASFSGWSVLGSLGYVLQAQGTSIILNIFFGVVVNAAQGITNQVSGVIKTFVSNFLVALNPQLVKNYASGNIDEVKVLILRGCRMSILLVGVLVIPIYFMLPVLLNIWLTEVPEYTVIFIRYTLIIVIVDSFSSLLVTAQGATGNIKNYQIVLTSVILLYIPVTYLFFKLGFPPYFAMVTNLGITAVLQALRVWYVCKAMSLPISDFYIKVILRAFVCLLTSFCLGYFSLGISMSEVYSRIFVSIVALVSFVLTSYLVLLDANERHIMTKKITHVFH